MVQTSVLKKNIIKALQKYIAFAVLLFFTACNGSNNTSLKIATAANLRYAMEEVNYLFEKETGIKVEMITASSGKLTAQIKNGAPYDVFLSANYKYPKSLYLENYSIKPPILFCRGQLVVWTTTSIKPDSTLANLTGKGIKKVGIANPQNAPYGTAADELLKNLKLHASIKSKLIFAENVSQLNQYVLNKAVDFGITAKSAVVSPKLKEIGNWAQLDTINYTTIKQYALLLKNSERPANEVVKYYNYLSSEAAKEILKKYGYIVN